MAIVYKGWIPTVAGRLSFSLIGEVTGNNPAVSVNRADAKHRYVISYQNRFLIDSVLPRWLSEFVNKYCGSFNLVCVGKSPNNFSSQNNANLSGCLFIFSDKEKWAKAEININYYQQRLAGSDISTKDLSTVFESNFNSILNELKPAASFWVKFTLDRNGVVEIILDENDTFIPDRPRYPSSLADKKRIEDTQAAQCFYFLREMVHKHQHHSPTSDTLLDLYRSEEDDNQWIGESLRVLYRKILDFKRQRKDEIYCSSLGLLSYAKSLKLISTKLGDNSAIIPDINDDLLKESIIAGQTATNNSVQDSIRRSDITRNTLIGTIGLFLSFTSLVKLTTTQISTPNHNPLVVLAKGTINNPFYTLAIVICLVFAWLVFKGVVRVGTFAYVREIHRLMQSFHKKWNVIFWLLITVSATIGCAYLLS